MATAVQTCVHCGFCLPTCPTYQVLAEEADSPRGRIVLMKQVLEGTLDHHDIQAHLDRCLGCMACETACPSGVPYSHLLSPYRDWSRSRFRTRSTFARTLLLRVLPYPNRFRWAVRLGKLTRWASMLLPKSLRPMLDLVPEKLPAQAPLEPGIYPAKSVQRARVALLSGCAQQVLDPGIHTSALNVMTCNGVEVTVPAQQVCCGALAWHTGHGDQAARFARKNLAAFAEPFDAIVSTAAGCGSALHEYPILLRGTDAEEDAKRFASISLDVLTFLNRLGLSEPIRAPAKPIKIAYHDACHLAHAQKETKAPRNLLRQIPNVQLVPLQDADLCCGSAGSYNIDQPEIARELGQRKANNILRSNCDLVALANIGCQVQIVQALAKQRSSMPVLHVIRILDLAYQGKLDEIVNSRTGFI